MEIRSHQGDWAITLTATYTSFETHSVMQVQENDQENDQEK